MEFKIEGNQINIYLSKYGIIKLRSAAVDQSIEIVRRRIDEIGTKEPSILKRGSNRILVELPGVKDPERIKDLLGKTAKLTFHLVDDENNKSLEINKAPFGRIIVEDQINHQIKYLV